MNKLLARFGYYKLNMNEWMEILKLRRMIQDSEYLRKAFEPDTTQKESI